MDTQSSFNVRVSSDDGETSTLVIGQAHYGMAGITAADYLVRHLDSTQVGHIAPAELPGITPFEEGVPRHHSRLYTLDGTGVAVLVGELFIPVDAARAFADAVLAFTEERGIGEIAVLHGVPFPHGPEEHDVFSVATPGYREMRLGDQSFDPLQGGFLDGVVGELVMRSLEDTAPETGAFITPTHPPGPDIEATLRLIEAVERIYDVDVDETELRELGEQFREYYEQLTDRMATMSEAEAAGSHDYPEDRMFM